MKRYALAALALLLCCALSGCMGLPVLWKGLGGISQPTPETTQKVKDEPEETPPAASAAPEETPVPDGNDFQSVRDALARNDGSFDETYRQAADRLYAREQSGENVNAQRTELLQIWLESKRDNSISSREVIEQYKTLLPDIIEVFIEENDYFNLSFDLEDINFDGIPEMIVNYWSQSGAGGRRVICLAIVQIVDDQPVFSVLNKNGQVFAGPGTNNYAVALMGDPQTNTLSWVAYVSNEWPEHGYDNESNFQFGEYGQDFERVDQARWVILNEDAAGRVLFDKVLWKDTAYKPEPEEGERENIIHQVGYRINDSAISKEEFTEQYKQAIEDKTLLRGQVSDSSGFELSNDMYDPNEYRNWSIIGNSGYMKNEISQEEALEYVRQWMDNLESLEETDVNWAPGESMLMESAWSELSGMYSFGYYGEFAVAEDIDDKYKLTQGDMLRLFEINLWLKYYDTDEFAVFDDEGYIRSFHYTEADVQKFLDRFLGEGLKFNAEQAVKEIPYSDEVWIEKGVILDEALGIGDSDVDYVCCFESEALSATEVRAYFKIYSGIDDGEEYNCQCSVDLEWDGEKWILKSANRSD